jgi:MoxR-vWA-beta-propeller ternary system domain bpX2
MASDATNHITYYLSIPADHEDKLGRIRHWANLKLGHEDSTVWVKELDYTQLNSIEVKSLPFKKLYYEKAGRLFFITSTLPERTVPAILWTAIDRAIPVKLPSFNHNYFGLPDKLDIKLVNSEQEEKPVATLVGLTVLKQYIENAPAVRLTKIQWVILNEQNVLLFGVPLLPITGSTYWARQDMLLPAGYDFEFNVLAKTIRDWVNPDGNHWIVWDQNSSYYRIPKNDLVPLSHSSFRLTSAKV